jgi:RHS repeat-associated protein
MINNPEVIGSDLFAFRLHYNDPANTTQALYNGNISQTYWKTANSDNSLRHYDYRYDALNRLTFATDNQDRYSENLSYDKNGNIMDLVRKGTTNTSVSAPLFGIMDQLTYHYDAGNKLFRVQDAAGDQGFKDGVNQGDDYTYDNNGNMISDANKGITNITYNHLNLPTSITFPMRTIIYTYDATGVKLLKATQNHSSREMQTTHYAGNYHYEQWSLLRPFELKFFSQPEGYVAYNAGIFSYIYQYKDHLGNNRLSYSDSNNDGQVTASEIIEEDNYYPFGLKHKGYNSIINGVAHKYKFNGKELQEEFGLNLYAYGWRDYDPAIGRWNVIDQLSEKYLTTSPYAFVQNNPLGNREIDGRYFEGRNERRAARIEQRAERRADKLERQANKVEARGGNAGDLRERASELRSSAQDIRDMRNDSSNEYRYGSVGSKEAKSLGVVGPSTVGTGQNNRGDNVISMFTEKNMGNQLHETRHGGQNARGEINAITQQSSIAAEVSGYRAQYSWDGSLRANTLDSSTISNIVDFQTNLINRTALNAGMMPPGVTVTNINAINQINSNFVNNIVEIGVGGGGGPLPTVQNYLIWIYAH